jgi:branched-subunit amino acid aminotransferase/4-amino-4-deoxychorismate lyase
MVVSYQLSQRSKPKFVFRATSKALNPSFSIYNGRLIEQNQPLILPDNRAFRYGEGLFETMRWQHDAIPLFDYHWQRLTNDLPKLYFELPVHFTQDYLSEQIQKLCRKNKLTESARIRLTIFKGEGGIWEEPSFSFNWLLQCWPLTQIKPKLNVNGLDIGVFEDGRKVCDPFSNIKSNNYLIYALAAQYAKSQHWNEAIVLNQHGRICDTTIANIFFIKNQRLYTPALSEGCVKGVMRTYLIEQLQKENLPIQQGSYTITDLMESDEIFLTNAIQGIKWVKSLGDKTCIVRQTAQLFQQIIGNLF